MPPNYPPETEPLISPSSTIAEESCKDAIIEVICLFPDKSQRPKIIRALAIMLCERKTPTNRELKAILGEHLELTIEQLRLLAEYRYDPYCMEWVGSSTPHHIRRVTNAITAVTGQDPEFHARQDASSSIHRPFTAREPYYAPGCALQLMRRMQQNTCMVSALSGWFFSERVQEHHNKDMLALGPALINLLAHPQVRYLRKLCEIYTGLGGESFDFDGIVAGRYTSR